MILAIVLFLHYTPVDESVSVFECLDFRGEGSEVGEHGVFCVSCFNQREQYRTLPHRTQQESSLSLHFYFLDIPHFFPYTGGVGRGLGYYNLSRVAARPTPPVYKEKVPLSRGFFMCKMHQPQPILHALVSYCDWCKPNEKPSRPSRTCTRRGEGRSL